MKQTIYNKKPLELMIHIISWLLVFILPLFLIDRSSDTINWREFFHHSLAPLCSFILFYINYLWLAPHYLLKDDRKKYILFNVIFIALFVVLLHIGYENLKEIPPRVLINKKPPIWIFYTRDAMLMLFVAGLATALKMSTKWREVEQKLIIAEREKADAELKNLKNQLNPHFLLNTLNNIYALIVFNSDKAQDAVQELSKLLRHVLYDNQQKFVPLDKELDFIRNYISLMKIRLPKNVELNVELDTSRNKDIQIAPLIFISLIENAFKHGISPVETSFIDISIVSNEDYTVTCKISNSNYPKSRNDKSGNGIGLEQVRKRLDILYSDKYEWNTSVNDVDKTYSTVLTIKTK